MKGQELIEQIIPISSQDVVSMKILEYASLTMNNDDLKKLEEQLPKDFKYINIITKAKRRNDFAREQEEAKRVRNHNITELLDWFCYKKSKKVVAARKELQRRFLNLSYKEQIKIIKLMLQGNKGEKEWSYNILRKWWSDELTNFVIKVWDTTHEERCGWLLTRYCTIDQLKARTEELSYSSNYLNLCKRLAGEVWFAIDKEKLKSLVDSDLTYLWIMSQTAEGVTSNEAWQIIYRWIAVAIHYADTDKDPESNRFHDDRNMDFILDLSCYSDIEDIFFLTHLKKMDKMLSCMLRMGFYDEAKMFLQWDNLLHKRFLDMYAGQLLAIKDSPTKDISVVQKLYKKYVQFVSHQFPLEYIDQLDYWKVLDNSQYLFEYRGVIHKVSLMSEEEYINATGDDLRGLSETEKEERIQRYLDRCGRT